VPLDSGTKLEVVSGATPDRVLGLSIFTVIVLSAAIVFVMTAFTLLVMAVYCDFNIITRLFGGASASKTKSGDTTNAELLDQPEEYSLEHLEKLIENALLKKRDSAAAYGDNILTINALV